MRTLWVWRVLFFCELVGAAVCGSGGRQGCEGRDGGRNHFNVSHRETQSTTLNWEIWGIILIKSMQNRGRFLMYIGY